MYLSVNGSPSSCLQKLNYYVPFLDEVSFKPGLYCTIFLAVSFSRPKRNKDGFCFCPHAVEEGLSSLCWRGLWYDRISRRNGFLWTCWWKGIPPVVLFGR